MPAIDHMQKEGRPVKLPVRKSVLGVVMLAALASGTARGALATSPVMGDNQAPAKTNNQVLLDGLTAYRDGRYSLALKKLTEASDADPGNAGARVYLALAQAATGDCGAALGELSRAASHAEDGTLSRLAGLAASKCEVNAGRTAAALALLEDLGKRYPKDADILYAIAKLHMKAFNDATLAMFQRAPASYRVHELSAEIFEVENRYSDAVGEYRKAIAQNPQAPNLHFRLGRALLLASHEAAALDAAKTEFEAELRLSPEDAACEFQLGQIAQARSQADEAQRHFSRALDLSPDFADALVALGKIESRMKQFNQAIGHLERATALQPANENAHYALMLAYRDAGETAKAKAEKATLDKLQRPAEGEFMEFLKKLGEKPPEP
jgi:tetratricopeptide (TPR) repeat protein